MSARVEGNHGANAGFRVRLPDGTTGSGSHAYELRCRGHAAPSENGKRRGTDTSGSWLDITPTGRHNHLAGTYDNVMASRDGTGAPSRIADYTPAKDPVDLPPMSYQPMGEDMMAWRRPRVVDPQIAAIQERMDASVLAHHVGLVLNHELTIAQAADRIGRSPADVALAVFVRQEVDAHGSVRVANRMTPPEVKATGPAPEAETPLSIGEVALPVGLVGVEVVPPRTRADAQRPDYLRVAFGAEYAGDPHDVLAAAVEAAEMGTVMDVPRNWNLPDKVDGVPLQVFRALNGDSQVVVADKALRELVAAA